MIDLKNVSKKYNNRFVLKNINLSFPRYGLVSINGPSGCGKSTLLYVLSTLLDFEGDIVFEGKNYKSFSKKDKELMRNKKIGFVYQDNKLFSFESVRNNILLSINMCSIDKEKKKKKRVKDLLSLVGLPHKENELISNLSGGEAQRVAIARAIANMPSVLLCDEPTGNLDEKNSVQVLELLRRISKSSLVILVSHDVDLCKKYSDEIITLKDGEVISHTYQNKEQTNTYLPVVNLKYNDKKRSLPTSFLMKHTVNSIKKRGWRSSFIALSTSLGLIGVGLSVSLKDIVSTNMMKSYSSIIDSNKVIVSTKEKTKTKDIITSSSREDVTRIKESHPEIDNVGVYYWNTKDVFPTKDFLAVDYGIHKRPLSTYNFSLINEYQLLKDNFETIYPNQIDELEDNEIVLSMTMQVVNELCLYLQINRSITTLSNYLVDHNLTLVMVLQNDNWQYSKEIYLRLRGFIMSTKLLFYHSNPRWNEYIYEDICQLGSTDKISQNSDKPWNLPKSYYLQFKNKRDEFLMDNRFNKELNNVDFELLDSKYYPNLYSDISSNECNRLLMVNRTSKDDIPSFIGDYFSDVSNYTYGITYGSDNGYSIYEESLMMGFSRLTYISGSDLLAYDICEKMSYLKYEDAYSYSPPSYIVEGHYSKSSFNGFIFEPTYLLTQGRLPVGFDEIVVSQKLLNRLNIQSPINKTIYLSYPVEESLLSNGYLYRDYKTIGLKIVGVSNSEKISISHSESWTILFFELMLGISAFDLRVNSLAIQIEENTEDYVIAKLSRAFPQLSISSPLREVKSSVDEITEYIEIIMLSVSVASIIIACLILFICNYLHFLEVKRDIGLVRCLGVKERESRKFVYAHSLLMITVSFVLASFELLLISVFLSKSLADSLMVESSIVINPMSFVYMYGLSLLISLISSFLISHKIAKIDPLECLR